MNTQKSVFNKISKIQPQEVELSEVEKVELALIDDVNKKANSVVEDFRALSKAIKDINQRKREVRSIVRDLESFAAQSYSLIDASLRNASDLSNLIKKLEAEAKNLGIDYNYDLLAIEEQDIKEEADKLRKLVQEIKAKDY